VDACITSLEDLTSAQYTTAVVSDNWGARFDSRIDDLEQRMADLELICLAEICDDRDDNVEALEGVVGDLQTWRTEIKSRIDDIHYDLHCHLPRSAAMLPQQPPLMARRESAAAYGSVTTIAPSPTNGMLNHPVPDFVFPQYNPYPPPQSPTPT